MQTRHLFLAVLSLSILCCGCTKSELASDSNNQEIQFNIIDVADNIIKTTAENLTNTYKQKPINQSASAYQAITPEELKELISSELSFDDIVLDSAKKIKDDVFFVLEKTQDSKQNFSIYKNNLKVYDFRSEPLASYSPLISIRVIGNKYTVEYLENFYSISKKDFIQKQRIWQDGSGELTEKFGINNAIMPFEIKNKMVFLVQKTNQWHVIYNGQELPEKFERIDFGYCCEPALYKPRAFNYRYLTFFATQNNQQKFVEIDFGE